MPCARPDAELPFPATMIHFPIINLHCPLLSLMNHLIARNEALLADALATKRQVESRRDKHGFIPVAAYTLPRLVALLREVLREAEVDLQVIERKKFGDDLCLKLPRLLKEQGNGTYMRETIPLVVHTLSTEERTRNLFEAITVKGIYINLRLSQRHILSLLTEVLDHGARYGESDVWRDAPIVVDYSSPNLAKTLHAGHIRSTIIGHILSNLYEAIGAYVYRTNHVNDLGGVGYLIEGYARWNALLPADRSKGQQLATLYTLFRSLQKVFDAGALERPFSEHFNTISACFPAVRTREEFLTAFTSYKQAATAIQERLERGDEETVHTWSTFVSWSIAEFQRFYDILGVEIDFVLGESFYLPNALLLIQDAVAQGTAVVWSEDHFVALERELTKLLHGEELSQAVYESLIKEARQDIGATVVPLANFDRAVILRADGVSIYTSRDLEAIRFRTATFAPRRIVYEVGVEQNEHFAKVFEAARILGICPETTELVHVAHESYVDAQTKKKLSSRDGSSGVEELLASTIAYFRDKYGAEAGFSSDETDRIAHQLGVGSIIFNDIKKDKKYPVEVQPELSKMHDEFERSGGAYVVYTACRARSIIRKWGKPIPSVESLAEATELDLIEIEIIKAMTLYPQKVIDAARNDSPAILAQYLLDLSRRYSSYYASFPVIKGEEVHHHRLVITKAVQTILENGLKLCAIECPERI